EKRRVMRDRRNAERLAAMGAAFDPGPDVRLPVSEPIFDSAKGLAQGWWDHGWSPHDLSAGKPASLDLSGFGGLILAHPGLQGWYGGLLFRYRAPETSGDFLEVRLEAPGGVKLAPVRGIQARAARQADGFAEVWIPIRELNPQGRRFEKIIFHAWRSIGPERVELAAVGLTAAAPPAPKPARTGRFQVDCRAPGHPISPLIYGIGTYFGDAGEQQWTLGAAARRWGGNHSSRYNPDIHAWNLDQDWFFRNAPVRSAESFLEENRVHGLESALTVPILGWVAKDTKSYSFPVSVYGPQQVIAWDLPDDGNGIRPDGTPIPSPPPTTTSVSCPPECIERWIRRMRQARDAGRAGVDLYILDNEPMIWHRTHRDVHPQPPGYDELLERTIAYGTAIRRADPDAVIAGPAECCWLNHYFSAKDVEASVWLRPDRLRHWNVPLLPWYLRKLRDHEKRTGTRVLDVVDVHFYPMADVGPPRGGPTDPASRALRIRTTRSLWDPSYVDESWIDEPIQVLPVLRRWIEENYPGRKISIGEWNFGAEDDMSSGLAVAEALGHFGTEGIYSAYYWTYPPDRSPPYWAFRAYRNFDEKGGRFLDRSAPVNGGAPLASLFASRDEAGGRLVALLLNHDPASPLRAEVGVESCGTVTAARAFSYSGNPSGFAARPQPASVDGRLDVTVEPYSITVVDMTLRRANP
ncbi:MAG: glycoside hydrolase family 44 protein, partial [Myxococcales bacterium]